jgi:hypothetical protein
MPEEGLDPRHADYDSASPWLCRANQNPPLDKPLDRNAGGLSRAAPEFEGDDLDAERVEPVLVRGDRQRRAVADVLGAAEESLGLGLDLLERPLAVLIASSSGASWRGTLSSTRTRVPSA